MSIDRHAALYRGLGDHLTSGYYLVVRGEMVAAYLDWELGTEVGHYLRQPNGDWADTLTVGYFTTQRQARHQCYRICRGAGLAPGTIEMFHTNRPTWGGVEVL